MNKAETTLDQKMSPKERKESVPLCSARLVSLCDSAGATSLHLGFSQANCPYEAPPLGREKKRSVAICNGLQ